MEETELHLSVVLLILLTQFLKTCFTKFSKANIEMGKTYGSYRFEKNGKNFS